jgi:peroxiredoxin
LHGTIFEDGAGEIGKEGRVLKAWRKVKVPGHAAEVLKAAKAAS